MRDEERVGGEVPDESTVADRDLGQLLVGVEREVDDLGILRRIDQRVGHRHAQPGEVLSHLGPAGVDGQFVAGGEEPLRHGGADLSRPDEGDPHRTTRLDYSAATLTP